MPLLTADQIDALRTAPLGRLSNRLQIAFAMSDRRQVDACAATGLTASAMSKLVKGAYQTVDVDTARSLADYFGCSIEDLFPAREAVAAEAR